MRDVTHDEIRAIQRGKAAFATDVARVVQTIAQRHRAVGTPLTWQLIREIREETLADLGLAARWPASLLEQDAADAVVPPQDGSLSAEDIRTLCDLARPVADVYEDTIPR